MKVLTVIVSTVALVSPILAQQRVVAVCPAAESCVAARVNGPRTSGTS
jgi:hypothetical protein